MILMVLGFHKVFYHYLNSEIKTTTIRLDAPTFIAQILIIGDQNE